MYDRRKSVIASFVFTCILCAVVHFDVNIVQPEAYMDEVFHEEQTLTYLRGEWTHWNPKITTPPGLYVLTTAIWKLLNLPASVVYFRFINCFIAGFNLFIFAELSHDLLGAIATLSLPVLTFTSFLFYTDQLSLFALLLTYAARQHSWLFSFFAACFACCVRQTNVVFVTFMVGQGVANRVSLYLTEQPTGTANCLSVLLRSPGPLMRAVLRSIHQDSPHLTAVIALFATLVVFFNNGDIVLGDRNAHQPSLHVAQMLYFFVFCAGHTPLAFARFLCRHRFSPFWCSIGLGITALIVHNFTLEHKYLLADNRHYTFYVWSKFFRRYPSFRYMITPIYVTAGRYVAWCMSDNCSMVEFLTTAGFLICTSLTLIPASLIEPRYFIAPYVIWRLVMPPREGRDGSSRWWIVVSEIVINCLVNAVTVFIFVYHPFRWFSQPFTWQRFMW